EERGRIVLEARLPRTRRANVNSPWQVANHLAIARRQEQLLELLAATAAAIRCVEADELGVAKQPGDEVDLTHGIRRAFDEVEIAIGARAQEIHPLGHSPGREPPNLAQAHDDLLAADRLADLAARECLVERA